MTLTPDLEKDVRFNSRDNRIENNIELIQIMDKIFLEKTLSEWADLFDKHGLIWTHIPADFEDVINDSQVIANEHIVETEHPSFGPGKIITSPIRLNKIVPPIKKFAPEIGQHNEEVLLEIGYTWDDIEKLKDKEVIP